MVWPDGLKKELRRNLIWICQSHGKSCDEIERDLTDQLDGVTLQYESANTYSARYTNNTNYDFDVNFYFWYYVIENKRVV